MSDSYRLNKYISDSGFCSRREADEYIKNGQVTVNGKVGTIGDMVDDSDIVLVGKNRIQMNSRKVYLAFNKPQGVTCTTDKKDPTNIIDYIGYPERIFPIGRLDKDSEGLILLTNDGDIVNRILRAGNAHDKEYVVTVNRPITETFITKMSQGVRIHNTVTLPCTVKRIHQTSFSIILNQGLNRQIRLMCEALGYEVMVLKRTRIMNLNLKGIEVGTYRELNQHEVEVLLEATRHSSKTEDASRVGRGKKRQQSKSNPSVRYAKNTNKGKGGKQGQGGKTGQKGKKKSPIRNKMKKKK